MSLVAGLSPTSRALFESVGWLPSHTIEGDLPRRVFTEVGGLRVGVSGPGIECAASDIEFFRQPRTERHKFFAAQFPSVGPVVAIADAHNGHIMLFLDGKGRFLAFTDPDSKLYIAGNTFAQCVDRLLLGYRWDFSYGEP